MTLSEVVRSEVERGYRMLQVHWKYFPSELERDHRVELVGALATLSLEHIDSILRLCVTGQNNGSALALARPTVETSARALWCLLCASEQWIEDFRMDQSAFPPLRNMLEGIEKKEQANGAYIQVLDAIPGLHDMTHGGLVQIASRFNTAGDVAPSYDEGAILAVIRSAVNTGTGMMFVLSRCGPQSEAGLAARAVSYQKEDLQIYKDAPPKPKFIDL